MPSQGNREKREGKGGENMGKANTRYMLPGYTAVMALKDNTTGCSVTWDISGKVKWHHCPTTVRGWGQEEGGEGRERDLHANCFHHLSHWSELIAWGH